MLLNVRWINTYETLNRSGQILSLARLEHCTAEKAVARWLANWICHVIPCYTLPIKQGQELFLSDAIKRLSFAHQYYFSLYRFIHVIDFFWRINYCDYCGGKPCSWIALKELGSKDETFLRYIREIRVYKPYLFIGKDIAVRREKVICENSRFLRTHMATPWRWNVIGLIFMMYEMQTLITFVCMRDAKSTPEGKIYGATKRFPWRKKKASYLQIV